MRDVIATVLCRFLGIKSMSRLASTCTRLHAWVGQNARLRRWRPLMTNAHRQSHRPRPITPYVDSNCEVIAEIGEFELVRRISNSYGYSVKGKLVFGLFLGNHLDYLENAFGINDTTVFRHMVYAALRKGHIDWLEAHVVRIRRSTFDKNLYFYAGMSGQRRVSNWLDAHVINVSGKSPLHHFYGACASNNATLAKELFVGTAASIPHGLARAIEYDAPCIVEWVASMHIIDPIFIQNTVPNVDGKVGALIVAHRHSLVHLKSSLLTALDRMHFRTVDWIVGQLTPLDFKRMISYVRENLRWREAPHIQEWLERYAK